MNPNPKNPNMKHTNAEYEIISQLFGAHDAKTPTDYAKEAYDRTSCGVWTSFVLSDGEAIPSHDLDKTQDTVVWATGHVVGIKHGTIVEGSDAEFQADVLYFPFSDKELAGAWEYLEAQSEVAWDFANENTFISKLQKGVNQNE